MLSSYVRLTAAPPWKILSLLLFYFAALLLATTLSLSLAQNAFLIFHLLDVEGMDVALEFLMASHGFEVVISGRDQLLVEAGLDYLLLVALVFHLPPLTRGS